ncbi:MAG TPA: DinB family protein [Sporosarcina sp.]|nr:DinB family protein [Sporosarcina sp.]
MNLIWHSCLAIRNRTAKIVYRYSFIRHSRGENGHRIRIRHRGHLIRHREPGIVHRLKFLRHSTRNIGDRCEYEYLFADWYLGQQVTEIPKVDHANKEALIAFLQQSDAFLQQAMEALSEEQWHEVVPSKMGDCTPIEVIGRLIYHAGMHAGQISDIQKHYA